MEEHLTMNQQIPNRRLRRDTKLKLKKKKKKKKKKDIHIHKG